MKEEIPEISIKLTSVVVKTKVRKPKTVREGHYYKSLKGKVSAIWYWLWHKSREKSLKEYLDSPIIWKWEAVPADDLYAYHDLDSELDL